MGEGEKARHAEMAWAAPSLSDPDTQRTLALVKERARILFQLSEIDLETILDALHPETVDAEGDATQSESEESQ